jgi:hypothetical protein
MEAVYIPVLMWQLYHRTVDKTHYTHAPPSKMDYQVKRGRSKGGSLRSSEMELLSMMCSRSASVVSEILENRDLCIRSMGPMTHPSVRESSLSASGGAVTIRNVGYTSVKDLLVDAVVVVLEGYLARFRVDAETYRSGAKY